MINLELGQLYGCKNYKELLDAIDNLKSIGMSDEEINEIIERSKDGGEPDV